MMNLRIFPPEEILETAVALPLSKSVSARALVINALTPGAAPLRAESLAVCDDVAVLATALGSERGEVGVGASATAMRFLAAYFAAKEGADVVVGGTDGLNRRPVGALVDALRSVGADVEYAGAEGFPPLKIRGRRLEGGELRVDASVSSQTVSALMLVAPLMLRPLSLVLDGEIASLPYIRMTARMMEMCGVAVEMGRDRIDVSAGTYAVPAAPISEPDWSAAAFWYEIAAVTAGWVTLRGLGESGLQGDSVAAGLFPRLGVLTEFTDEGAELSATPDLFSRLDLDATDNPDLVPALVVTSCLIGVPFRLSGVARLRLKECDRLEALVCEMRKIGCLVETEGDNVITWEGARVPVTEMPVFDAHGDHRIAMALAAVSVFVPGIVICDAGVVSKSYPGFWQDLRRAGFTVDDADVAVAE